MIASSSSGPETLGLSPFTNRKSLRGCRILYLVGRLHTGGLERQLGYVLRCIDRQHYRPGVAVWDYRENDLYLNHIQKLGVPVYPLPRMASRSQKLRAFRQLVTDLQPEVVHSYNFYTNFAAYWGSRGTRAISIGSIRSDFHFAKREVGWLLGSLNSRWPGIQICNSSAAAEAIRVSRSHFVPRRCLVVRNGLDLKRFQNSPVPTDTCVSIVGIGYLLPAKRWDRLLMAAAVLKRKGVNYVVHIAGDGPLEQWLRSQAVNNGVADRVSFLGHVEDVSALLARSNFLVHTADTEGCPNAVMEAMGCGRAIVATSVGDIPSLVDHGETGFLVSRDDCTTLVRHIIELIDNREMCQRMGKAGRVKAEREFGLDRLVQDTLAAYRTAGWTA